MGKSTLIGVRDALRVYRLVEAMRELPPDPAARQFYAANALCRILGAQAAAVGDGQGFRAGSVPHLSAPVGGGWIGPAEQRVFENYIRSDDHTVDPALPALARVRHRTVTRRRRDLVADEAWYAAPHVSDDRRAAGVDDVIYSMRRPDRQGRTQVIAVHRPWGDRVPFDERDRAVLNLFHRLADPLIRPPAAGSIYDLARTVSPRLRETLDAMLAGLPEKRIARKLGVTPNTAHGYVKEIYDRLRVESRGELMARWLRRE